MRSALTRVESRGRSLVGRACFADVLREDHDDDARRRIDADDVGIARERRLQLVQRPDHARLHLADATAPETASRTTPTSSPTVYSERSR